MAKSKKQARIHIETHTVDGISYEVIVDAAGGKYWGRWICQNGHDGAPSVPENSISRAVLAAKMNLGTYHGHTFRGAPK